MSTVCSKSASSSPGKPTMRSVDSAMPGTVSSSSAISSRYRARVYPRCMRASTRAAPGHRHHAEGATLLAALHHGDKGLELAHGFGPSGDLDEGGLARLQHGRARRARARHQLTHTRHRGRAEHEVDGRRSLLDLPLPELGHAAHDADEDVGPLAFEKLELPQAREDLVLALLADGAGVQEDQIGVLRALRQLVALIAQQTRDALRVVLVHLTAVGDQVKFWHKRSALTLAFAWEPVKPSRLRPTLRRRRSA